MNLSEAITRGAPLTDGFTTGPYNCPLGAAYLGTLRPDALAPFWQYIRSISDDSLCQFMHKNLMRLFPHLGQSVRSWPRMAEELERERVLPRVRAYQTTYRQEIHRSLWRVITDKHAAGVSKQVIAEWLEGHRL